MKRVLDLRYRPRLCMVVVFAAFAIVSSASAATNGGLPPALGHLCGHVKGAAWQFQGHTGTQYNVTGTAAVCSTALKSVGALTKQTPHAGAVGTNTLVGPKGFQCAGSGIPLAHAGFCGSGGKHFLWAPRLS